MTEAMSATSRRTATRRGSNPIRRITCIQLSSEFPDFCYRLVMPDYGMPLIGTILAEAGYQVTVFVEHVHPPRWEVIEQSDLVLMSTMSAGADRTYRLADRIRSELGIPVVIGGTHSTYFVEDCLEHCDYVVMGEGDETILDLVDALSTGRDPGEVDGIAFRRGGRDYRTPPRLGPQRFDTIPDFQLIHGYRRLSPWDMIRLRRLPLVTVQASRGCHFHCTYCIVDTMFAAGYRKRDLDSVIADLKDKRQYGRELLFVDNDFAAKPRITKELLKRMIEEDLGYDIIVLARADVAKQDELLELMRKAGVTQVYQGYESIEPETLTGYDKRQTVERIQEAVRKLQRYGFRISGSFVLGADTDSLATVRATTDFVLQNQLTIAYFFPLWGHYVEQKNGNRSIVPRHRAIFKGWAYCDGNFVTHFPKKMRPSQLQAAVIEAHQTVFSTRAVADALRRRKFADAKEKLAHRFMWGYIRKGLVDYIPWLEEIEHGFYDAEDRLLEDQLLDAWRRRPDLPWRFDVDSGAAPLPYRAPVEEPIPEISNIRCRPSTGLGI